VYKVFPDTQTVITWIPGILETPMAVTGCIVRDRLNWQCKDSSGVKIMDGNHFEDTSETDVQYVSRLDWLFSK
jgi:hypothetical protein